MKVLFLFTGLSLLRCFIFHSQVVHSGNSSAAVFSPPTDVGNTTRYVIMDNDWDSTAFLTFLIALDAGMTVLALVSDTCDSWVEQLSLHAVGNVSNPTFKIFSGFFIKFLP